MQNFTCFFIICNYIILYLVQTNLLQDALSFYNKHNYVATCIPSLVKVSI